ncbi:MAG: hypothetical protein AB7S26_38550 [Sandaracinaceae bacterium]
MSDGPNDPEVGGGPPPSLGLTPSSSLADDEKALKKGNTGVLVAGIVAALLVTFGIGYVVLVNGGDDSETYGNIGRAVNGMKQEHFDGFWACALPGQQLDRLSSDQDVRRAINERAGRAPRRYAELVRTQCIVKLNEHEPGLRELIPPEDLATQITDLTHALVELRGAWNDYIAALEQASTEEPYDEETYSTQLTNIARGWFNYKTAYNAVNETIRGHINP